ncbi:MAG: nuclear transport factor 2 family protein [Actinomycetota bacterium]
MDAHELHFIVDQALATYCRGVDRLDPAIIAEPFHDDALLIDYAPDPVPIGAFAERVVVSLGDRFYATQHRVSNLSVDLLDDGAARAEAYVLAFHAEDAKEGRRLHTFNGRYIDRYEERGGVWKISRRHLRVDWSSVTPIDQPMGGEETWVPSGGGGTPHPHID